MRLSFDELVAEANAAPIRGWDFSWLEGRATEERPSWRYMERVAERAKRSSSMLDLQVGGGEWLSRLGPCAPLMIATEGWASNVAFARSRLRPLGIYLVATNDESPSLPFADESFDIVTSRHPVETRWDEAARVLRSGGTFLSQQVGPHTAGELTDFLMGPQPQKSMREPQLARQAAEAAGLDVVDLRAERLRMEFRDIGAVVYFLRLVVWIVPGFTVTAYRPQLSALHDQIQRDGPFIAHSARFLIEAYKGLDARP